MHRWLWSHSCEVNCCNAFKFSWWLIAACHSCLQAVPSRSRKRRARRPQLRCDSRIRPGNQSSSQSEIREKSTWPWWTSWLQLLLFFSMPFWIFCPNPGLLLFPTVLHPRPPGSSSPVRACRAASYAQILRSTPGAPGYHGGLDPVVIPSRHPWNVRISSMATVVTPGNPKRAVSTQRVKGEVNTTWQHLCWFKVLVLSCIETLARPSVGNFCEKSTSGI